MLLNEVVKSFLLDPKEPETSSYASDDNVLIKLGDEHQNTGVFFDETNTVFGYSDIRDSIQEQKKKISKYRQVAMIPDVDEAVDIITNEIIFSYNDELPILLQVDVENEKLNKALNESFEKIAGLTNLKRNFYQIVKRAYIDGQINLHCPFDAKNPKKGIQAINMIEPCGLVFDREQNLWVYADENFMNYGSAQQKEIRFSPEELVHENFGLYDGKLKLSYLEYAIKSSNMLKTLEDLLIPLRFSRSISRRVFNVDIGDLPPKRGSEVMNEHQQKFKYRKFYNNETGEVSNQQHITSMVEDYWFANRSGGKGTQVDLLDETGNLGELDDILYFAKKLYRALKIPSNRVPGMDSSYDEFDYDTTRTSKEDLQFFMLISRLRVVFSSLFKEVLRREAISTGIMSTQEWEDNEKNIKVIFREDNAFIEKMNLNNFMSKMEIYSRAQEQQGKLFSVETILKEIFSLSDEEIKEESKKIAKEMKDPLYKRFYEVDEDF